METALSGLKVPKAAVYALVSHGGDPGPYTFYNTACLNYASQSKFLKINLKSSCIYFKEIPSHSVFVGLSGPVVLDYLMIMAFLTKTFMHLRCG